MYCPSLHEGQTIAQVKDFATFMWAHINSDFKTVWCFAFLESNDKSKLNFQ